MVSTRASKPLRVGSIPTSLASDRHIQQFFDNQSVKLFISNKLCLVKRVVGQSGRRRGLELRGRGFKSLSPDVKTVELIRNRYAHYGDNANANTAVADIRILLKEIDRLKAELIDALEMYYSLEKDREKE